MNENELSRVIVEAAIEVHRVPGGPGLLEAVYEEALVEELQLRRIKIERQQPVPVIYKGKALAAPLRLDLRINGLVLVECKAVTEHNALFESQLLTYLRLTGLGRFKQCCSRDLPGWAPVSTPALRRHCLSPMWKSATTDGHSFSEYALKLGLAVNFGQRLVKDGIHRVVNGL